MAVTAVARPWDKSGLDGLRVWPWCGRWMRPFCLLAGFNCPLADSHSDGIRPGRPRSRAAAHQCLVTIIALPFDSGFWGAVVRIREIPTCNSDTIPLERASGLPLFCCESVACVLSDPWAKCYCGGTLALRPECGVTGVMSTFSLCQFIIAILHNLRVASYSLRSIKLVDKINVSRYIYISDKFYEDEGGTFLLGMLCC
jgi:hypothetical protein